jgi:O-antigen/teichoic acid export membrane protein
MNRPKLSHNVAALTLVQAASYLFPLVTIPYLTRMLGVESFGKVVLVQSLMALAAIVVDYGFSLSAVRTIAAVHDDKSAVSRIYAATLSSQALLYGACLLLAIGGLLLVPMGDADRYAYIAGALMAATGVASTQWLFQAFEQLKVYSLMQIGGRALSLPFLFLLVDGPEDVAGAIVFGNLGALLANGFAIHWAHRRQMVQWSHPGRADLQDALSTGFPIFTSKIATSVFQNSGVLVVGAVAGNSAAGLYALAEKIRKTAQSVLQPVTQALYPRMCHLFGTDPAAARQMLRRVSPLILGAAAVGSLLLFVLAEPIVLAFGGAGYLDAVPLLRILAALPLVASASSLAGLCVILPKGLTKPYNAIIVASTLIYLAVLWPLVGGAGTTGAVIALVIAETSAAILAVTLAVRLVRRPLTAL